MSAGALASTDSVIRHNVLNRIAAFGARSFPAGITPHNFVSVGGGSAIRYKINPTGALVRNNGRTPKIMAPKSLEYHLDLLSLLGTGRRQALRDLWRQPGSASLGYLTFSDVH